MHREEKTPEKQPGGGGLGISNAGFFSLVTFGWVTPLVAMGSKGEISLHDGLKFFGEDHQARRLAAEFDESWRVVAK
eukprot:scaffold371958_cov25-Prasinocladus_malaysianus.AAC.1